MVSIVDKDIDYFFINDNDKIIEDFLNSCNIDKEFVNTEASITVNTRKGFGENWEISNNKPEFIGKSRKIVIYIPILCQPFRLIVYLQVIKGIEYDRSCCIEKDGINYKNGFNELHSGFEEVQTSFLLKNIIKKDLKSIDNISYGISITIEYNNKLRVLHEWIVSPTRKHKYESSKKGKEQHNTNNEPVIVCIDDS